MFCHPMKEILRMCSFISAELFESITKGNKYNTFSKTFFCDPTATQCTVCG